MIPYHQKRIWFLLLWALIGLSTGCAEPATSTKRHLNTKPNIEYPLLETGKQLMTQKMYLSASYYLEASLLTHTDEQTILPLLVSAQVRAGRLLAAASSLERLISISPNQPYTRDLLSLVRSLLEGPSIPMGKETKNDSPTTL